MKLDADWLRHSGTVAVMQALEDAGHTALFVGGCVRNAAMGLEASDIDIATDARPEAVIAVAKTAGLKAIGTGVAHGTVTVVAEDLAHEITTFRRDVETDGRRAVVGFSQDFEEDAARRDFTINALYAHRDGTVLDPTGQGLADIAARRVRFIGEAEDRIREDHLRILRFFRFHAYYAAPEAGFDAEDLAAISTLSGSLETISRERIGQEMCKLLDAPDPAPALATMGQCGVLRVILPGADPAAVARLIDVEQKCGARPDWRRRLVALGGEDMADRLRLSKKDDHAIQVRRFSIGSMEPPGVLGYVHGEESAIDALMLRAAAFETEPDPAAFDAARVGAQAVFPVKAADLMPELQGPALGDRLGTLEIRWMASGFTLTREDLLA